MGWTVVVVILASFAFVAWIIGFFVAVKVTHSAWKKFFSDTWKGDI